MENQIHAVITIPPEYVILKRDVFEGLVKESESSTDVWWDVKDIKAATKYKTDEIVYDLITYPPYKKEIEELGGYYSSANGDRHSFPARPMREWLENNHNRIKKERHLWRKKGK